jgi:hypothetical protein
MKSSTLRPATEPAIRVLRPATCPSLSGKSKLSYEIGCKDGSGIQLRIVANSAAGSFSREWIEVHAIEAALDKAPRGAPITSEVLRPLFRGTSSNNQLFCFAVLKNEGLVRRADQEKRVYERADAAEFAKWTQLLIGGKAAVASSEGKNRKAKAKAETRVRKPTASRKKERSPS